VLGNGGRSEKRIIDWEMAYEEVKAGLEAMVNYKAKVQTRQIKNETTFRLQIEKARFSRAHKSTESLQAQLIAVKDKNEASKLVREAMERAQKAEEELAIALGKLGSLTRERDEAVKKLDEIAVMKALQLKARYRGGPLGGPNPTDRQSSLAPRKSATGGAVKIREEGSLACSVM
jgi:hypothetical protein